MRTHKTPATSHPVDTGLWQLWKVPVTAAGSFQWEEQRSQPAPCMVLQEALFAPGAGLGVRLKGCLLQPSWHMGTAGAQEKAEVAVHPGFPHRVRARVVRELIYTADCPRPFQDVLTRGFQKCPPTWVFPSSNPRETQANTVRRLL